MQPPSRYSARRIQDIIMTLQDKLIFRPMLLILLVQLMGFSISATAEGGSNHVKGDNEEQGQEETKGPNGGKLLREGELTLELAIFERGVPPEYRVWITRNGQPVENAQLRVTLTRLGGQEDIFTFQQQDDYWLGDGVVIEPHSFDVAINLQLDRQRYQWQWESHEGRVEIAAEMAQKVAIRTAVAGPGSIERHIQAYGRLATPPDQSTTMRARFPGIVTDVRVTVGDRVNKGDVLAVIESNESLQRYQVRAPMDGVVGTQTVSVGETANDTPIFTLVSNDTLWAELKIFPGQRDAVKAGQTVHIRHNNHLHESQLKNITTTSDGAPFVVARAMLRNESGDMAPGDLVVGQIDVEKIDVPLAVDNRALQDFRDWRVVFIKVGNTYEIRPLELGRSDGRLTEVLDGLNAGDHYVVENSYLIKADIEKSGASHDH
jgi:cobalt-zinc-cadmium efflux system membrane fusion protein